MSRVAHRLAIAGAPLLCLIVAHGGCKDRRPLGAGVVHEQGQRSKPEASRRSPNRTTRPETVLGNLDLRIDGNRRRLAEGRASPLQIRQHIGNLRARAQYLGTLADYTEAQRVAEKLVAKQPKSRDALLELASARASLHLWAEAREALERARAAGLSAGDDIEIEAQLAMAEGNVSRAMALRSGAAEKHASLSNLTGLAIVQARLGRTSEASANFERAARSYRKPSPLPLVWSMFQHGLMWERAGKPGRAAALYERALERFPRYAPLAGHLAAILITRGSEGDLARAEKLLRVVVERADDPAYTAQLGELLTQTGRNKEGSALIDVARAHYAELLAVHPAAFAGHAVEFYLGAGRDPARALELAELALENRPTAESHELVLRASAATESPDERCQRADIASSVSHPTAQLHFLRAQAFRACGHESAAARALAAARAAP